MRSEQIKYLDAVRKNFLFDLHHNLNQSIKSKAMLSLKYDDLNFWVTLVQISIIVISTGLTVMNSIKSYFELQSQVIDVISIVMTALIGLIMAIYRFYKMDERKEALCNLRDNYTGIINKFNKVIHRMDHFVITDESSDDWDKLKSNYQDEVLDNYLQIREDFETIFDYQDIIHYKNKFKRLYLRHEIINNEIDTVHFFKKEPMSQYQKPVKSNSTESTRLFSPRTKSKHLNFDEFINNYETKYLQAFQHQQQNKKTNQELYEEMINPEDANTMPHLSESSSDGETGDVKTKTSTDNNNELSQTVNSLNIQEEQPDGEEIMSQGENDGENTSSKSKKKKNKNPLQLTIETPNTPANSKMLHIV